MENERLIQALNRMVQLQEQLLLEIQLLRTGANQNQPEDFSDLVDIYKVMDFLKISRRSFFRLKKDHIITTIRIGKRDYYNLSELKKLVYQYMK